MQYQMNLFKGAPDEESIKMIQYYEKMAIERDPRGYCVCTSKGKDSRVLGHLMRRANVKHFYLHSITGIDPPELIYFQRRNFQEYKDAGYLTYDVMYKKSIWQLMLYHKMPPTRQIRYCCRELKEKRTDEQGNAIISLGVRKYESTKRAANRDELEIEKPEGEKNIIMPFDNDENRKMFENCLMFGERRLNPIAYWQDCDIWNYSEYWKLEQCSLYCEGFKRLGCIGCPMAGKAGREREFARWPKFKEQYIRIFGKMIEARKAAGLKIYDVGKTKEEWFEWWLSDRSSKKTDSQMELEYEQMFFRKEFNHE